MIPKQIKNNEEIFTRTLDGKFVNEAKLQDELKVMNRPLSNRENELIEQFIKRQKEKENDSRTMEE